MMVFDNEAGTPRLIGRCEVQDDGGRIYEVLVDPATADPIWDRFSIDEVEIPLPEGGYIEDRAILVAPGQDPAMLPDWEPLAS